MFGMFHQEKEQVLCSLCIKQHYCCFKLKYANKKNSFYFVFRFTILEIVKILDQFNHKSRKQWTINNEKEESLSSREIVTILMACFPKLRS